MSDYRTPADYAAQTAKWRDAFGIWPNVPYAEQVRKANEEIASLKTYNPSRYKEFMADAQAWGAREEKRAEEYNETRAPVTPSSSGRNHDNGEFIVLNMSTADGTLEVAMEHCYRTGDVTFGHIISAYSNTKWRYDVTCVAYDAGALTPAAFLSKVSKTAPIEFNVNSEYVATASTTGLAYRKKGTCKIRCAYVGQTSVKPSDSPQYNDGKERVPVHYTV
jgi:hypothetical protein